MDSSCLPVDSSSDGTPISVDETACHEKEPKSWDHDDPPPLPEDVETITAPCTPEPEAPIEDLINSDGQRYIWGPDIKYKKANTDLRVPGWRWKVGVDDIQRNYYYQHHPMPLKFIDRPKRLEPATRRLIEHKSINGWNLPVDHPRHILQFPPEILGLIIGFCVIVPKNRKVAPDTRTINWGAGWWTPSYRIMGRLLEPEIVKTPSQDERGPFIIYKEVIRPEIDATVLRACKLFRDLGEARLLTHNAFEFPPTDPRPLCCPAYMMHHGQLHRPQPRKPAADNKCEAKIVRAISQIREQVYSRQLPGWVYYDQFLRFLHDIGPRKAAMIRQLKFGSNIAAHADCEKQHLDCKGCKHDFIQDLHVYLPIIRALCPGVKKLHIVIDENTDGLAPEVLESRLRPVLDYQLSQIEFLETVIVEEEVRVKDGNKVCEITQKPCTILKRQPIQFARPVIEWIANRAADMAREGSELALPGVSCAFCRGNHSMVECPNLCQNCGAVGHFRCSWD